jgi:hypothetical protein
MSLRANGSSTIKDVYKEASYLSNYWFGSPKSKKFDAVFVQVGIVDVSPRIFPKPLYPIVSRVPLLCNVLRSRLLNSTFGRPWSSPHHFQRYASLLYESLAFFSDRILFIEIAPPAHFMLDNLGDFSNDVKTFNQILFDLGKEKSFVRCWQDRPAKDLLLPDGHHLNMEGHRHVADCCSRAYFD